MVKSQDPIQTPQKTWIILSCFFLSGASGLIYQVLWIRMIDKVIGSAPFAVATVLTVFMAGLALGSYLAGKAVDRAKNRGGLLSLYGKLEIGIGIYGLLLPLLIVMVKPAYSLAYNHLFQSFWIYGLFAFFGCACLLILPAAFMGASLPILCRFYVTGLGHMGTRTGRLYAINTAGAAVGAGLTGFLLVPGLGVWGSLGVAAAVNLSVGLLCAFWGRRITAPLVREKQKPGPVSEERYDFRITWALGIFAVSGFCAMAYEVIWTRLLGLIIGPTTYSFTLVVATFIVGLALGSLIFGWLGDRARSAFGILALTQLGAAVLALGVSQFLGNSQFFFAKLIYVFQDDFAGRVLIESMMVFLVLLGPSLLLGATFPLVNKLYARNLTHMGQSIGTAYALNTIGAILGSFAAGFLFIPFLGKENSLRLVTGLQFGFSLAALGLMAVRAKKKTSLWLTFSGLLVIGALLFTTLPDWKRQLLSYGRYRNFKDMEGDFARTSWLEALWQGPQILLRYERGREVVFYGDGIAGFTTVERLTDSLGTKRYTLLNSGKPDASSHGDRSTQTLLAHVPLLFHPDPQQVMVLGLASGMTAGEVLHYPVSRMDVLEINEEVVKACRFFAPWNNNCLNDPRSRIIVQDGRNHLSLTNETYDVIISEPSNPWMAGLANLYTLDFLRTVKKRLRDKGIFVQWIHSYEMDWSTFALAGRTFAEVFPEGLLMGTLTGVGDYLLVGFKGGSGLDLNTALRNFRYAKRSENMTLPDPRLLFYLVVTEDLKALFGPGPLHTDNRPRLEFAAPKQLYKVDPSIEEHMSESKHLSPEIREIVEQAKGTDMLLRMLEFASSVYSPLFALFEPARMDPAQEDKYLRILRGFCARAQVTDYDMFPDKKSREVCAAVQVAQIRRHLAVDPEDGPAYYSLGLGLKEMGRVKEAIQAFKETVAINPLHAKAYNNLGVAYREAGEIKKAREAFLKVLAANPFHAKAYFNLAQIAMAQGDRGRAVAYLKEGLLHEDNPKARELLEILIEKR